MKDFNIYDIEFEAAKFNPLPTNNTLLDNRYNWQRITNGAEWPYYRFFYHLSGLLQPDYIVELGGWQGTAAAHFAAGRDKGQVVTIDHHTDPGDQYNRQRMIEVVDLFSNLTYHQGWSNPEAFEREKGHHHYDGDACNALEFINQKIDILYIDSWHTYDNAMLDWKYYRPLLNSPALVICDDIQNGEVAGSPISGMLRFWDEMPEPKFLNSNLHPGTNMGFIKV